MSQLSTIEFDKFCSDARLTIEASEKETLRESIGSVITFLDQLAIYKDSDVLETASLCPLRDDIALQSSSQTLEIISNNFPQQQNGKLVVPTVITK
jgi:Asp-tRNA(Asn)/Glu-tRNA(Gln) amidotransferase C subunit